MPERKKGPRLYRTGKTASRSVAEIMALLAEFGAESFHVQQKDGKPVAIAFVFRGVAFQMAPSLEGLERRLSASGVRTRVDALAVAWAQLRNLLEMQLEVVENGAFTAETVFAGHALTSSGRTVGAMLEERQRELMPGEVLLLPSAPA